MESGIADTPDAFATFLARAGAYTSILTSARQKLVLVEDLPNILHPAVRARFHDALRAHVERGPSVAPVVLVVSDAGLCVEASSNGSSSRDVVIDGRTVLPPGLPAHLFSEIRFLHLRDVAFITRLINKLKIQPDCAYSARFRIEARDNISKCAPLTEHFELNRRRCWRRCTQRNHDIGIYVCTPRVWETVK